MFHRFLSLGEEQRMTTRNTTHDIHVTQLVKPEIVHSARCQQEVPLGQLLVDLVNRRIHSIEDPLFHEALVSGGLDMD